MVAGTGRVRSGDLVVWLKPVAVVPAVLRRDGRVQAAGHPADHARLGLAEDLLDELCGGAGTIDEIARAKKWCLKNRTSTPTTTVISASTYSTTAACLPTGSFYSARRSGAERRWFH
jgi:hypothetical protein